MTYLLAPGVAPVAAEPPPPAPAPAVPPAVTASPQAPPVQSITGMSTAANAPEAPAPPPAPPVAVAGALPVAVAGEPVVQQIELLLAAFGKALEAVQVRQGRDVLHVALTAQQEHLAILMQALADHRHDYGEQLERAVRRLSDELTSESVTEIGELFHRSAGEITGALTRSERLSGRLIEKQNQLLEALSTLGRSTAQLVDVVTELRDIGSGIARSMAALASSRVAPVREPERRLQVVAGRPDILESVREDLDQEDEPQERG